LICSSAANNDWEGARLLLDAMLEKGIKPDAMKLVALMVSYPNSKEFIELLMQTQAAEDNHDPVPK